MLKTTISIAAFVALAACDSSGDNSTAPAAPVAAVAPPAGTEWVTTVAETADGGFRMGNPDAPIKLVEYGAYSCSHCAEFSEASSAPLREMVATGKVSYEFRSYLLGGQDVPASLLVQCAGPGPFFTLLEQSFAAQKDWMGKLVAMSPADQQAIASLPQTQQFARLAEVSGLDQFVRQRGVPAARAQACLSDTAAAEKLVAMRDRANSEYNVTGTPTFLINGQVVPQTAAWEALLPKLRAAGA